MRARFSTDVQGIRRQFGQVDAMGASQGTIQATLANRSEKELQMIIFDVRQFVRLQIS